jgi:spermidine/putrescine transport system ATP-binding protein
MADTPLGALQISAPIGAARLAMIRPEKIWLYNDSAAPQDRPNVFPGKICEAIYMGASTQYRVELPGGQFVLALDTNNAAAERSWRPGEPVAIELKPDNIMLIEP